jgi:hypothetical protein
MVTVLFFLRRGWESGEGGGLNAVVPPTADRRLWSMLSIDLCKGRPTDRTFK